MRFATAIFCWLVASVAYGQIEVKDQYGLYEPVEYQLKADANAQAIWEVRPLDDQTQYTSRQYGDVNAFWGQPGRYQLIATVVVVDFDARRFDVKKYSEVFTITGDEPTPPKPPGPGPKPPEPTPDVPADQFDNLGQRVDAEADKANLQVDKRQRLAEAFFGVADGMKANRILRVSDAAKEIEAAEDSIGMDAAWQGVRKLYVQDGVSRTPMSREDAIAWYEVVGVGLNGGPR